MVAPALVAVHIPAGTDHVVFQFHGYSKYPELLALAGLTLAIIAGAPLYVRRARRRRASSGSALIDPSGLQSQRQRGTRSQSAPRQRLKRWRQLPVVDDRVAPIVERDEFGEQLGALAVRVAGDGVDDHSHLSGLRP